MIILFAIWGAVGGLGIGIASKKDKKLFIVLGGTGLAAGVVVTSHFWNISSGIGGTGSFIGILEGIALGFYYMTFGKIEFYTSIN